MRGSTVSHSHICLLFVLLLTYSAHGVNTRMNTWAFLGPFPVGKTEIDGDPVGGPAAALERYRQCKGSVGTSSWQCNVNPPLDSEFVPGSQIKHWSVMRDGVISPPNIDWRTIGEDIGIAAVEFQGWTVSPFAVDVKGVYQIHCPSIHHSWLLGKDGTSDPVPAFGDIYSTGYSRTLYPLTAGRHYVISRIRGRSPVQGAYCDITGPVTSGSVYTSFGGKIPNAVAPDIVDSVGLAGERLSFAVAFETPDLAATVAPTAVSIVPKTFKSRLAAISDIVVELPDGAAQHVHSGQVRDITVALRLDGINPADVSVSTESDSCVSFTLEVVFSGGYTVSYPVTLRCRTSKGSFRWTFKDHDGRTSYAALIMPQQATDAARPGVVLTLSGVGVSADNQADSHKYVPGGPSTDRNKDYVFGHNDMWILAPERPGAHNWEGVGHQTAWAALLQLREWTERTVPALAARIDRVFVSGHSRGGHGSLLLGSRNPDAVMGVVSVAGWLCREQYGDANLVFHNDVSLNSWRNARSRFLAFEAAIEENDVTLTVPNIRDVPVYIGLSDSDTTVSPWFMKRMFHLLAEEGNRNVTYREYKGKGHWWWDSTFTNDGGAMFDRSIRSFYSSVSKHERSSPVPLCTLPKDIVVMNVVTQTSVCGIRVGVTTTPGLPSYISLSTTAVGDDVILTVATSNVESFAFVSCAWMPFTTVVHNGIRHSSSCHEGLVISAPSTASSSLSSVTLRKWSEAGPMSQVFSRPIVLVVGTRKGAHDPWTIALREAALFLAASHYSASGTSLTVLSDVAALDTGLETLNAQFNMVVIGGPCHNAVAMALLSADGAARPGGMEFLCPDDTVSPASFSLDGCLFSKASHYLVSILPAVGSVASAVPDQRSTISHLNLMVHGNSVAAVAKSLDMSYSSNQPLTRAMFTNMLPEFIVGSDKVGTHGLAGMDAAGWYDSGWKVATGSSFVKCSRRQKVVEAQKENGVRVPELLDGLQPVAEEHVEL